MIRRRSNRSERTPPIEDEEDERQRPGDADDGERRGRVRELVRLPGDRDQVDAVAEKRHGHPGPEQREVALRERPQNARSPEPGAASGRGSGQIPSPPNTANGFAGATDQAICPLGSTSIDAPSGASPSSRSASSCASSSLTAPTRRNVKRRVTGMPSASSWSAKLDRGVVVAQLHPHLPLGVAARARLGRLAVLLAVALGLDLARSYRQRNVGVLPLLLDGMPALQHDRARRPGARAGLDHARGLARRRLVVGVEEDHVLVTAHGDAVRRASGAL